MYTFLIANKVEHFLQYFLTTFYFFWEKGSDILASF